MKKLAKIFEQLNSKYFNQTILKQFLEEEDEIEEYHNPFLGIYFFD